MKPNHRDDLDELLRLIDRSGLCRADPRVSAGRGSQSKISPIKKRLREARFAQPAQERKILLFKR